MTELENMHNPYIKKTIPKPPSSDEIYDAKLTEFNDFVAAESFLWEYEVIDNHVDMC